MNGGDGGGDNGAGDDDDDRVDDDDDVGDGTLSFTPAKKKPRTGVGEEDLKAAALARVAALMQRHAAVLDLQVTSRMMERTTTPARGEGPGQAKSNRIC